jgi:lipid-binding SYLF domain-containing protein
MKKFLTALCCLLLGAAALPLSAATPKRASLVERIDTAEAILQDLQASTKTAIPRDILRRARALVIVNQVQAGIFLGIKDGYAVAMVRRPNGQWSLPAFLNAGEASFGLQAGIKSINTVLVIMDDPTARLLLNHRFNFGAEAKVIAGVRGAEKEAVTKPLPADANVYAYSLGEGYYMGVAVKTGFMSPNESANEVFYNTKHRMPELLYSNWVQPVPEVKYLMDYVTRLTN